MISVVVLEEGAEYPKWITEYRQQAPNCTVIAHTQGEGMEELLRRVTRKVAELDGELRVGVVACATSVDEQHLRLRADLCRVLLGALKPTGNGEVVLAASWRASDHSKFAVFELAGTLCESLRGSQRVVRVRFSKDRPESGFPRAAERSDAQDRSGVRFSLMDLDPERARQSS